MIAGGVVYGVMIGMAFTEQVDIFFVFFARNATLYTVS